MIPPLEFESRFTDCSKALSVESFGFGLNGSQKDFRPSIPYEREDVWD